MAEDDGQDLEGLRRDLYRRGAGPHALDEYLARRPVPEPVAGLAGPVRSRRRPLLVGAVGTVVLVVLIVTAAAQSRTPPRVPRMEQPAWTASGEVVTPYGAIVPLPTRVAISVDGEAAVGQRYRGTGDARFPLDTAGAPMSGRIVLTVQSLDGADVHWTASVVDPTAAPAERRFAKGSSTSPRTADVAQPYPGPPPTLLEIEGASTARWTATVAFLPAAAAGFR